MSEDDEEGAQKLAVLIGSMLIFATLCVLFSCYRLCIEKRLRKKQQQLTPIEDEPIPISNIVNQTGRTLQSTDVTANQQSDRQLVFGPGNILTTAATTEINLEIIRHRPLVELQHEYERRARERRANLDIKDVLPPYSSKDESLPSYDQAVVRRPGNETVHR